MTKKDYIKLAEVMKDSKPHADNFIENALWLLIIGKLANMLKADNANFKPKKFMLACGIDKTDIARLLFDYLVVKHVS